MEAVWTACKGVIVSTLNEHGEISWGCPVNIFPIEAVSVACRGVVGAPTSTMGSETTSGLAVDIFDWQMQQMLRLKLQLIVQVCLQSVRVHLNVDWLCSTYVLLC
jgi:hypothetical protein